MQHFYDRATMAHALTAGIDPFAADLIANLNEDLIDYTEFLIIEPGDTEADIIRHVGFSPLIEPIDGARFGGAGFHPYWDWLGEHHGLFQLIVTFGSTFAYIMLIHDEEGTLPELRMMCRRHVGDAR